MAATVLIILSLFSSLTFPHLISSETFTTLTKGSSLSPQDTLVSTPQPIFTAGFFPVGENAFIFSTWFTDSGNENTHTTVWMANRDQPVNGENTDLRLDDSGNLILTDAGQQLPVWTSNTKTNSSSFFLSLRESGNLVLTAPAGEILWQSFDFPTNTLLPGQPFTRNTILVSLRSQTNYSSGYYRMYFDGDSILHLRYEGPEITSVYWPNTWITLWSAGRSTFNSSKIAVLDSSGEFRSSDLFVFKTLDFGVGIQRRMVLDDDGDLRVYSLDRETKTWVVTWQHTSEPCRIHGICGENSLCVNGPEFGRKCTCLPGYKIKNSTDWSFGCVPDFDDSCPNNSSGFIHLPHVEFYLFDLTYFGNYSFESCRKSCLEYCECKGFQYRFNVDNGYYNCWLKSTLFNGYRSLNFPDPVFIRLPAENLSKYSNPNLDFTLQCTENVVLLERNYQTKKDNTVRTFAFCTLAIGGFEVVCLLLLVLFRARKGPANPRSQGYVLASGSGFRKFSYSELKKASRNFSEEIGRGGAGVVYKGVLSDNRVAAIKFLKKAIQCEATFLAEINTIGRLNHMNLIEMWGFCAEGDRRLLVYKYLENESLAKNLHFGEKLDWKKRYEVALGTAKGLAYLHEECLEWVLHCDVKPQNILLDENFQPKVADFGLSRILTRNGMENKGFSRIRGTRGYMAPEWVFNLPITSKVDVYSYGIVVLELVTGKSPSGGGGKAAEPKSLVGWVRSQVQDGGFGEVVDPCLELDGGHGMEMVEFVVKVALQCTEEDREARPTMRQVVNMLLDQVVT